MCQAAARSAVASTVPLPGNWSAGLETVACSEPADGSAANRAKTAGPATFAELAVISGWRMQIAVSAKRHTAGRVIELRHPCRFAAAIGLDRLPGLNWEQFGRIHRQGSAADRHDQRPLSPATRQREQPCPSVKHGLRNRSSGGARR